MGWYAGRVGMVAAALVASAIAAPAVAAKPPATWAVSVSRVSGPSPFPESGCDELDHEIYAVVGRATGLGTPVPGKESDVSIAVNPADPQNLVAAWVQDEAAGLVTASSFDGGATWERTTVDGLTSCTGGEDRRILHARLAAGPDGRFYLTGEALNGYFPDPRSGHNRIPVVTSTDGGRSWSAPVYIDDVPLMNGFDTIAADPNRPGTAYVAWHTPEPLAASYISRTTDGGQTWDRVAVPRYAVDALPFNRVLPAPDGTLHVLGADMTAGSMASASLEAGALAFRGPLTHIRWNGETWSERVIIGADVPVEWVAAGIGSDGTLYVSGWGDQIGELVLWTSPDRGVSWTGPLAIATTGTPFPVLAVAPDGTLGVTVKSPPDTNDEEAVRFLSSRDRGVSWTATPVLTGPLDRPADPGFYQETVATPTGFASVFVASADDADGPVDAHVAVISRPKGGRHRR